MNSKLLYMFLICNPFATVLWIRDWRKKEAKCYGVHIVARFIHRVFPMYYDAHVWSWRLHIEEGNKL